MRSKKYKVTYYYEDGHEHVKIIDSAMNLWGTQDAINRDLRMERASDPTEGWPTHAIVEEFKP
jgi:hypothetical protein